MSTVAADRDVLRRIRLTPYRKGMGPQFTLTTWDTGRRDSRGQTYTGYELRQHDGGKRPIVLFHGEDFSVSPLYAIDSDKAVAALLGFLTLRPGDTDDEYFEHYTDQQREYCDQHAETLGSEAIARFGED